MSTYHAPLQEMQFVLNDLAGLAQVASLPGFEEATADTVTAILEEAAKFASNVLDPLNVPGDREGATRLADGSVKTASGFKEAYRQFIENGWNGLTKNPEYGGQGLPQPGAFRPEGHRPDARRHGEDRGSLPDRPQRNS